MCQKFAKFKGAEYFRKALYVCVRVSVSMSCASLAPRCLIANWGSVLPSFLPLSPLLCPSSPSMSLSLFQSSSLPIVLFPLPLLYTLHRLPCPLAHMLGVEAIVRWSPLWKWQQKWLSRNRGHGGPQCVSLVILVPPRPLHLLVLGLEAEDASLSSARRPRALSWAPDKLKVSLTDWFAPSMSIIMPCSSAWSVWLGGVD